MKVSCGHHSSKSVMAERDWEQLVWNSNGMCTLFVHYIYSRCISLYSFTHV